ncbi:MAG: CAAX prenyl protease-related protein [Thermodesulfobacteriota bacterium]
MAAVPYILPFFIFALLTLLGPPLELSPLLVYPLKTVLTGGALLFFRKTLRKEITFRMDWPAVGAGILVFLIWIIPEGHYPQLGGPAASFNPAGGAFLLYLVFHLLGSSLVVPVMEEVFWRSFALRFLIDNKFTAVPLGKFTWFSFILVSIAFGFEHHRWLPGIMAGLAYALVLYRTKNLFSPILAHGVTNFLLAVYVITTGSWHFW